MKYAQPSIVSSVPAISMIQTTKDFSKSGISTDAAVHLLVGDNRPSNPAYEADE